MMKTNMILLADDDPDLRYLIMRILESRGYSVSAAADGDAAAEMLTRLSFDLVISDVDMPGNEELRVVRIANCVAEKTPVIVFSGRLTPGIIRMARELGAVACVEKSVNVDALLTQIDGIMAACPAASI